MDFHDVVEGAGKVTDAGGVVLIIGGALFVSLLFALRLARGQQGEDAYTSYRHGLGRAILLGLELLVAADIIRTVAVTPTFRSVGVLAAIVLIRTFLSMSLELEITGRWPWQHHAPIAAEPPPRPE
jgi:uncharacterized membrane protein